ncbi:fibronectin type III domain-containing protein [Capsulimonas corticalis]|nr:RHS repeat-associated core domain-containing protein [Capsulimonas corticalis]
MNYYYVVTATGAGGTSALSNEASALPTGPPIAPGTLAAVSLYEQISLTWSASPGATSYNLGRSTTPGGPYSPLVTSANTGYTDQSAAAGTTYYYVVSATNAYATSGNSNEVSAAALLRSPGVIGITVTPGNSQLGLHWPATNGAIGYNIKRSLSSEGTYTTIASGISSTSYTDSSLINGTNYFYVVSSVSNLGETFDSTEAVGTPRAATSAAVSSTAYGYNGDGLRAWKQNALGRTYYLYDGSLSVCELASNGNVTAVNTFIGSNVSSRRDGSVSTLYNFDPQGNPAERMDAQGSTVAEYMFDAYGLRVGTDNSADPYSGFGGEWGYNTDPDTGLELLTHRYYDPAIGSFLTRDPIGYNGGGNLYRYTINNPIIYSDPEGTDIKGNWNKFTNKAGKIWSETSGAVKRVYGMVGVGIAALNFLTPAINHIYDWQITGIRTECYQNLDKNRKWYDNGGSGKDGYEKESPFMGYLTFQEYEGAVVDKAHAKSLSAVETSAADAMSDYYNGVAGVK